MASQKEARASLLGTHLLRGQVYVSWAKREEGGQPGVTAQVTSILSPHLCDFCVCQGATWRSRDERQQRLSWRHRRKGE